jgi:hypothetical protein
MSDKKLAHRIFREDGLAVIQERLRRGTYAGDQPKWAEA